jgi:uncharacterized protein
MSVLPSTQKNHLANEKSPYLLQHASNPVDWYPWGETALTKARNSNRPIFISIGYSTCHWCHVMAHESFEDIEVAEKLNKDFISIKVDREERPDIDTAFMQACQLLNKHGGWPLNLFLTPEGKPFYALTYAPKINQGNQPGFISIIEKVAEIWKENPENLIEGGDQLSEAIQGMEDHTTEQALNNQILEGAAESFRQSYDNKYAGFGSAPKFPQPHNSSLLLRLAQKFKDPELMQMALNTLNEIEQGGITDQLGGGIHRYSVDAHWLVPHFEKMLYDQALIAEAYLDAWQSTKDSRYKIAAESILDYVLRELQHPQGGFYCGEDADSEGVEGTYYLWSEDQLAEELDAHEIDLFKTVYNVTEKGNFENSNILHRKTSLDSIAGNQHLDPSTIKQQLALINDKLMLARDKRPHPHLDDKILTGWNGLIIAALARGSVLLRRPDYLSAANKTVSFIHTKLFKNGRLQRRFRQDETVIDAFHEDYAYLVHGLIELFLADFNVDILDLALKLSEQSAELFKDDQGGYYDSSTVFIEGMGRGRSKQDGAIPAAASVTARNLIRLARLTDREEYEKQARKILTLHLSQADKYPTAFAYLLMALELTLSESFSLVIVAGDQHMSEEWTDLTAQFRHSLQIIIVNEGDDLSGRLPFLKDKIALNGLTTAWFCTGSSCLPPANNPSELKKLLDDHMPLNTFSR